MRFVRGRPRLGIIPSGVMSGDPLDRLRQLREECDRAFDPGDVEAHDMRAAADAENLALRLAVNAQRQMAQARRLTEKLRSKPPIHL